MAFMAELSSWTLACVKALSKWLTQDSKFPSLTEIKKWKDFYETSSEFVQ